MMVTDQANVLRCELYKIQNEYDAKIYYYSFTMDNRVGRMCSSQAMCHIRTVQLNANLTPTGKQPTQIGILTHIRGCVYRHTCMPQVIFYG